MAWRWRAALNVCESVVGDRIQREPDDAWTDDYGEGMRFLLYCGVRRVAWSRDGGTWRPG